VRVARDLLKKRKNIARGNYFNYLRTNSVARGNATRVNRISVTRTSISRVRDRPRW